MTFSTGELEEAIPVVLDSNLACFISANVVPLDIEDNPTTIVLTTAVVPIPAGLKSSFNCPPERYAV